MDLVEVEITGMAITARYGTLKSGTILRTDKDYAKHLVDDCGAAKYTTAQKTKPTPPAAKAPAAPRKKAGNAEKSPEKDLVPPAGNELNAPPAGLDGPAAEGQEGNAQIDSDSAQTAVDTQQQDSASGAP